MNPTPALRGAAVLRGCARALLLLLAACGSTDGPCTNGALQCSADGALLEECVDGAWVESDDCAAQGLECDAGMGHCMAM